MAMALTGFEGQDVRSLIDRRAVEHGGEVFLIWEPFDGEARRWTYGAFADRVRRTAAGIVARGVRRGDRILIHLDNCPEFLFAWLACAYAGAVAVTTNTRSVASDIAYFASHSGAVGGITETAYESDVRAALSDGAWLVVTQAGAGLDGLNDDPANLPDYPADQFAPFGIQYTSGTTGRPKAVLWTHANLLWGASLSARHEELTPDDIHLVFLPLFHTNAQVYSVLASLWAGGTVVLQPRFSASRFWEVAIRNRCTWTSLVPFCTMVLLEQPAPERHSFRCFGGAATLPHVEERFKVRTIGWWGMTETVTHGIVSSLARPGAPLGIGFPAPGYEIFVLNDQMQPVAPGETGDLYVRGRRGASLFMEYAGDEDATAKAFTEDGLFITGDRVRLEDDGTLFFVERAKDMLKVGGENVAASEIERVILGVDRVREVAVVAKPHPLLEEVPVAFVIPSPNSDLALLEEQISRTCTEELADFKRPSEIRFVDDLPRSTLNKVAKAVLREKLAE